MRTAIRSLGQPILLVVTFGLVLGLVAGAGALLLPDPAYRPEPGGTALPSLDELTGATALMAVSGGDGRRILLDRLKESEITEDGVLRVLFQGPDGRLLVTAPARAGEPIAGDGLDVLLVLDRTNYFPKGCTLALTSLQPTERVWDSVNGWMAGPEGAGTLSCEVAEDGDEPFQIDVVFRLEQIPA